ncbi:hypothetical protein NC653_014570 [Populus alba x Populus x berolinensis]|uniref:Uncharacterized protein n=1 Tax=Populus alba x Populus x berolinensis TaxID=444605 RepID=A0AAD6QX98_9ROSI|nr:hypothetical protein NC653_014570 [Populus alba x Populus x berolinensis]
MCVCTNRSDGAPNLIGFQVSADTDLRPCKPEQVIEWSPLYSLHVLDFFSFHFLFSFFSHHSDIENFIAILFDDGDGYLKNEFSLLSG